MAEHSHSRLAYDCDYAIERDNALRCYMPIEVFIQFHFIVLQCETVCIAMMIE